MTTRLEVCVVDLAGVGAARQGGADSLELCAALEIGGVTPTRGFVTEAIREGLPSRILIRVRGGDFVYTKAEIEIMRQDITELRKLDVVGFAIGALTTDGALDMPCLEILRDACGDHEVTLHRAFDQAVNQELAVEQAVALGFHRILTSGGRASVIDGLTQLSQLSRIAGDRIRIVPGGGIVPENIARILEILRPSEIHASCKSPTRNKSSDLALGAMGNGDKSMTDFLIVQALSQKLANAHE